MRASGRVRGNRKSSVRPAAAVRRAKLLMESLEPRAMFSAQSPFGSLVATPDLSFFSGTGYSVYSPAQIRHAYGFDQVSYTGAGQTIAIVDAYDDPTVSADLHKFDQQWGLSDPTLTVAKMTDNGKGPAANSGWDMEIALDVEWAHAMAPGAKILLVEANSASLSDLLNAVNYARNAAGVSVVSMSWGAGEFSSEGYYDSYFTTPAGHAGVSFVASSGDSGAPASWPSISQNVLAVGGTTLNLSGSNYGSETGWSGSGGGYSPFEPEPVYQRGVQTTGHRTNPDVGYDADPHTGYYVEENGSWYAVGGTSAGAPQWAGLIADVNQGRAALGMGTLGSSLLPAIYGVSSADFHDVTSGNNGYAAGKGYDVVTGRGSPVANLLIRDLVNYGAPATTTGTSTTPTAAKSTVGAQMQKAGEVADFGAAAFAPQTGFTTFDADSQYAGSGSAAAALANTAVADFGSLTNGHDDAGAGAALTVDQSTPADALPAAQAATGADESQPASAGAVWEGFDSISDTPQADRANLTGMDFAPDATHVDAIFAGPIALYGNFHTAALRAAAAAPSAGRQSASITRSSNVRLVPAAVAACFLAFETRAPKRSDRTSTANRHRSTLA